MSHKVDEPPAYNQGPHPPQQAYYGGQSSQYPPNDGYYQPGPQMNYNQQYPAGPYPPQGYGQQQGPYPPQQGYGPQGHHPPQGGYYQDDRGRGAGSTGILGACLAAMACCCCLDCLF
jgi:hypothetical protein